MPSSLRALQPVRSLVLQRYVTLIVCTLAARNALAATPITSLGASVPGPDASSSAAFSSAITVTDTFAVVGAPLAIVAGIQCGAVYMYARPSVASYTLAATLVPPDGMDNDYYGSSAAAYVSSDASEWALIGAGGKSVSGVADTGVAYLYSRASSAGTWALQHEFGDTSAAGAGANFASAVAMTSTSFSSAAPTLFIGAPAYSTSSHLNQGAVYVFAVSNGTWTMVSLLFASDGDSGDSFGTAIAVSGTGSAAYLLVGANSKNVTGNAYQGVVYGFAMASGVNGSVFMVQTASFAASDGSTEDFFGSAIVMSSAGVTIVCAPSAAVGNASNAGAAYVFARAGNVWLQQQRLSAAAAAGNDTFCTSIAMDAASSNAVIGAPGAASGPLQNAGTVYLFTRYGNEWAEITQFTAADAGAGDSLGQAVALNAGSYDAILGAPIKNVGTTQGLGAMYVQRIAGAMPSRTASPSMTATRTASVSSSVTSSSTVTPSMTVSVSASCTVTSSGSPSFVPPSTSPTTSSSITASITASGSITPSVTASGSITSSVTPTTGMSSSVTPTTSVSASTTASVTLSGRPSLSSSTRASVTPSNSAYASVTSLPSTSPSVSPSVSQMASPSPSSSVPAVTASPTPSATPNSVGVVLRITHDDDVLDSLVVSENRAPQQLQVRVGGQAPTDCVLTCGTDDPAAARIFPTQSMIAAGARNASMSVQVWAPVGNVNTSSTILRCTLSSSIAFGVRFVMPIVRVPTRLPVIVDIIHVREAQGSVWFASAFAAPVDVTAVLLLACGPACSTQQALNSSNAVQAGLTQLRLGNAVKGQLSMFASPGDRIIVLGDTSRSQLPFTADVNVSINGAPALELQLISSSAVMLRVPPRRSCTSAVSCDGLASISIAVPVTLAALGSTLMCPLTCSGDFAAFPLTIDGLSFVPAQVAAPMTIPNALKVDAVPRTGLFVGSPCMSPSFTPTYTRACSNSSDPRAGSCGFGEGTACVACPRGALCPGGQRVWPQRGFTAACEACATIQSCAWPADQRCLGWNASIAAGQCGVGYSGPACSACASRFYRGARGDCISCSADDATSSALARMAFAAAACVAAVMLSTLTAQAFLFKAAGERWDVFTLDHLLQSISSAVYVLSQLQLVAQVTFSLPPVAADSLATAATQLQTLQWWGGAFAAAGTCNVQTPLVGSLTMLTVSLICALGAVVLLVLHAVAFFPAFQRRASGSGAYHPVAIAQAAAVTPAAWRVAWTVCIAAWTVTLPGALNAAVSLVECAPLLMNVRAYVSLLQDGTTLRRAGEAVSAIAASSSLLASVAGDTTLTASVLAINSRVVCYEGDHKSAAGAAWLMIVASAALFVLSSALIPYCRRTQLLKQHARSVGEDEDAQQTPSLVGYLCSSWRRHARLHGDTRSSTNTHVGTDVSHDRSSWRQAGGALHAQAGDAIGNDALLRPFAAFDRADQSHNSYDLYSLLRHGVLVVCLVCCDRFTSPSTAVGEVDVGLVSARMACIILAISCALGWVWWRALHDTAPSRRRHRLWFTTACHICAIAITLAGSIDALRRNSSTSSTSRDGVGGFVQAIVAGLLLAAAGMLILDSPPAKHVDALPVAAASPRTASGKEPRRDSVRPPGVVKTVATPGQLRHTYKHSRTGTLLPTSRRTYSASRTSRLSNVASSGGTDDRTIMELTPIRHAAASGVSV